MLAREWVKPSAGRKGSRWRTLRQQCFDRDRRVNARCWICGEPIDYAAEPGTRWAWEPDHRLTVDEHPELAYDPTNIMPAHASCNRKRGAEDVARKRRARTERSALGEPSEDFGL